MFVQLQFFGGDKQENIQTLIDTKKDDSVKVVENKKQQNLSAK